MLSHRRLVWYASGLAALSAPILVHPAEAANAPVVQLGNRGDAVKLLESDLSQLGFYHGALDGFFGPQLQQATQDFQRNQGLRVDGVAGPETWTHIDSALASHSSHESPDFQSGPGTIPYGSSGPAVQALQKLLNQNGANLTVDGNFGPMTYAALRNYQSLNGLAVTGKADAETLSYLKNGPPKLSLGSSGEAVKTLQSNLTKLGYSTYGIDGKFGSNTEIALEHFQRAYGLSPDGVYTPQTAQALDSALARANDNRSSRGDISATAAAVVGLALHYEHSPYVWGGSSPAGFDCSGFTSWIYDHFGVHLPRTSFEQWNAGPHVARSDLAPGDLVFFTINGHFAEHVGIFIGNNDFISATNPSQGVVIQSLDTPYWANSFDGAVRVLK